ISAAQGWCGSYFDLNGNGKFDEGVDKRIDLRGVYGVAADPIDGFAWASSPGVPGRLIRINPTTCASEVYEPPFVNPDLPGIVAFGPRGIDVDSNGLVWTALAGSGHLASFDRNKCKVKIGPRVTDGQHCPEGWALYSTPGPRFKYGVTDDINVDYHYYNWVD